MLDGAGTRWTDLRFHQVHPHIHREMGLETPARMERLDVTMGNQPGPKGAGEERNGTHGGLLIKVHDQATF